MSRGVEDNDRVPLNDLSRSLAATTDSVRDAVLRVLASGQYVHGPEHTAFETELAAFLGAGRALGVASGTDALTLALLGVGCESGTEVVTAANAGGYAAIAAARIGCQVAYADVDPLGLVLAPETVAAAIGPATLAVVVTHLYGNVADVDGILAVCRPRGIAVVEDCAQAFGAISVDGRRIGTVGDAAALSFYPTKNLGGAGDGGAVITSDEGIAQSVLSLREYGWGRRFTIERAHGMNSRLDEIQAAILRNGLEAVDRMNARRRSIVQRYVEALHATATTMVSGTTPTFVAHLAVVRTVARDHLRDTLARAGIGTAIHYPIPDHRQPGLPEPTRVMDLATTERAVEEILTIPCFPEMTDAEVERVCDALRRAAA